MCRHVGRSQRRSRGQSLVEFALVIPIFLLIVFALIDMGRLVYINNALAEGAREGARWGSVQSRSQDAPGRTSIGTHATDSLAAVPNSTVTVTCLDQKDGLTTAATCVPGDILVVQVDSPVTMLTPILAQIVGPRTYTAISKTTVSN